MMNHLDDNALINNVKNGQHLNESTKELIHRHSGVYFKVAHQFKSNPYVSFPDVIDNKDFNIYHAALNYDSSRGSFCNLVGQTARYECLKHIQSRKSKKVTTVGLDEPEVAEYENASDNVIQSVRHQELVATIDSVLAEFPAQDQEVFRKRLNGDCGPVSWRTLREGTGYSHQGLINKNIRIVRRLREKLSVA